MFYTPSKDGFPPIVNGKQTKILKWDEEIRSGDWCLIGTIRSSGSSGKKGDPFLWAWRTLTLLDMTPMYPDCRTIIRIKGE